MGKKKKIEVQEEIKANEPSIEKENENKENVETLDSSASKPEKEPKKVEVPKEDFKSKYYYLAADMDNLKKRFNREKENLLKYGNERILKSIIDVVDDFDRTLDALSSDTDEKTKTIIEGVDMVKTKLINCLALNGLEPIESIGKIFDPNFHEAMSTQTTADKKDQEIITEFQKGYLLNGRLLRASKVIIAKNEKQ